MLDRLAFSILGRKASWRLGRSLYMLARGDKTNNITTNGEMMVQRCVVDAWKQEANGKLIVFDVGANEGDWSEAILNFITVPHERTKLVLYMFEPIPSTFDILQNRLANIGKGTNLNFHQLALSSSRGIEKMYIHEGSGINSLHTDNVSKRVSIEITKDTIYHFCILNSIDEITLLKCDTEGHDMEVIMGAMPLLIESKIKVFQFEYNHRWIFSRHYLKDVFDLVCKLPYKLGKIQPNHIELYSEWHSELERFFEANYLLIHNDFLKWFNTESVSMDKHNTLT